MRLIGVIIFTAIPLNIYTQNQSQYSPSLPFPPSAVRLEGGRQRLSSEIFVGFPTDDERRKVIEESKKNGFSHTVLIGAQLCAGCHQDVVDQWAKSAHRFSSFNNPFYEASIEDLRKEDQGKVRSRWCASCHDPALLFTGDFDTDFDRNDVQAQAGLTCLACHGITSVAGRPGNGNYIMGRGLLENGDPFLEKDGKKRVGDPAALELHKRNVMTSSQKSAEFCGSCHKASLPAEVNNFRWFRAQNDYDPWHDSGASGKAARAFYDFGEARRCQDCHMAKEPAVLGDLAAKNGFIRSHRFLGVNTALPALRKDEDTIKRTKEFLAGSVSLDLFAVRRGKDFNEYLPGPEITKPTLVAGEEIQLDLIVRNHNVGHTFPGGTLDLNEGWIEVTLVKPDGTMVAKNGDLEKDGSLDPEAHGYCALLTDESGKPITKHNVAHVRTIVWRHVISFGESDLVRYRVKVPRQFKDKSLTIRSRLMWRKFNEPFRRFSQEANPKGFPARSNFALPVIELARAEVSLRVAASSVTGPNLALEQNIDWRRFNDYGIGALLQNDFSTAEYAFLKVQELAPDKADGFLNYARTMIEQGNSDEGLKVLNTKAARWRDDRRAIWSLGQAYFMRREYSIASQAFQDILKLLPEDRQSWNMLARSWANQGHYKEALLSVDELLQIDPANEWGHYLKGRALEELDRKPEAEVSSQSYEKFREDYFAWNRQWRHRLKHPIDHREAYSIHWHTLRYLR